MLHSSSSSLSSASTLDSATLGGSPVCARRASHKGDGAFTAANALVIGAGVAALVLAAGSALLSGCAGAGGGAGGDGVVPALTLAADTAEAPADGFSIISVEATVKDAPADAVVTFTMSGVGLLSETNATILNGRAAVELWAPFESDLTAAAQTSTITASITAGLHVVTDSVDVKFTVPTTGAPVLSAHSEPDRVVAGSGDAITVVIDGRRLTSSTVAIESSDASGALGIPSTLTLDADSHGSFDVVAPADPVDVDLTITADGAPPQHVVLHFIAADAPAFDLTGTFAQISFGGMKLGNLVFLDPNPQCVSTPSFALVHVTQTGAHIEMQYEICDITMPTVNIVLIGAMGTHVGHGFIDAMNESNPDPLVLDLDDVGPGAQWEAPPSAPTTIGAILNDPNEPLPTTADDPRVVDQDGDGYPAVTISGDNSFIGDKWTVMRTKVNSMTGTIQSSDLMTGVEDEDSDSTVVNGDDGGLSPEITKFPTEWVMARVDGVNGAVNIAGRDGISDSVSCADVISYEQELAARFDAPEMDCQ